MPRRAYLPTLLTLAALACGLGAIEAAHVANWHLALRLILLGFIIDGLDGTVARRLGVAGPMGGQLDSLSDFVTFGVAPAFIFTVAYPEAFPPLRLALALIFAVGGAYRLARFHILPASPYFTGLPIPSAGVLLSASIAGPFTLPVWVAGGLAAALAALMVSHHPFPTFAQWRKTLLWALGGSAVLIAVWPSGETLAIGALAVLVSYVLWGFLEQLVSDTGGSVVRDAETHA
jgi:CDP-diacylglycerol--serine O-phosphatidyltransferase